MKAIVKYLGIFLSAAVGAGTLSTTNEASAWVVRSHASKCMTLGGVPYDVDYAIHNDSTTEAMRVLCPIVDETDRLASETDAIYVWGYDNNDAGEVTTLMCFTTFNMVGGDCNQGPSTTQTGRGNFGIELETGSFWDDGNFAYIWVSIPAKQNGARSSFRGFQQSGS
jgi:hypothetical protein